MLFRFFEKMIEIDCESLYIKSLLIVSSTVMIGILGFGYLMNSEHNFTLPAEIALIGNIQSKLTYDYLFKWSKCW